MAALGACELNVDCAKPGGKGHDPSDGMRIRKNLEPLEW